MNLGRLGSLCQFESY
ncbi:hypothetical protein U9M48_004902 [Paspalum notatum var. saurae]|uniref:Uncharacterized protein n=1 Tax=Paspalum notatum var. saurae TaxID=547442 RepID=A0AAQ3PWH5_PASNO